MNTNTEKREKLTIRFSLQQEAPSLLNIPNHNDIPEMPIALTAIRWLTEHDDGFLRPAEGVESVFGLTKTHFFWEFSKHL
jgi:hypothetical protein